MNIDPAFSLTSVSGTITNTQPLESLQDFIGDANEITWEGKGFNQIWRPVFGQGSQDRFLELNETNEKLTFNLIPGDIPNRGLLQKDINLKGLRYLQQIFDANVRGDDGELEGIHIEHGMWLSIPTTTNPQDGDTVARLATIPHGTSLVAQGTAVTGRNTPQIDPVSITPFIIGQPGNLITFPESTLTTPSVFRTPAADIPNVTQAMVTNPNSVLTDALMGVNITSFTKISISTKPLNPPTSGGGVSNIAFLQGGPTSGPNASAAEVSATFWLEHGTAGDQNIIQLQYSQLVLLNFNGLSWPHVSVATLRRPI